MFHIRHMICRYFLTFLRFYLYNWVLGLPFVNNIWWELILNLITESLCFSQQFTLFTFIVIASYLDEFLFLFCALYHPGLFFFFSLNIFWIDQNFFLFPPFFSTPLESLQSILFCILKFLTCCLLNIIRTIGNFISHVLLLVSKL